MSFVHLHNHSHYSLLDGLTKIDDLIARAKAQGSPAVAITDHGVMYGVIEFYEKCQQAGIKPIIGVEAYVAPASRFDKKTRDDARNFHLILLAKNNIGYKNLIKLTSLAHLEGFYYKPRVDLELLEKYHEGLIASTACLGGEIPHWILSGKLDKARTRILEFKELFGKDNFYLEIMDHPELEGQEIVNQQMIKFSEELDVPLLATNDVHYLLESDAEVQDILLCLQNKKKREDEDRMKMLGKGDYSMRSNEEMIKAFAHVPQAIANTLKVAEMCNVTIELGNTQLPHFEVPDGYNGNSYLHHLCEEGIKRRYAKGYPAGFAETDIINRMEYELGVVEKMGWPSYFLIVADFINWAKSNKIVVGPGRGSAAGSLVCYLTGITNLDPLQYDLLFERFLNPDRISMPDIDMDFADIRRDEVIRYVESKYGQDHVSQIITFGTMAARAAVRDVGRVLNMPYDYCDRLAKMIPANMKLAEVILKVPEVKVIYETEDDAKKILDYAKILEGVARHSSMHACGVLITKDPLTDNVPVQYASSSEKSVISQYSLHPIEDLGLLKMDFLGLKNLTIIESALKIIKNTRGIEIDMDEIPLNDKLTFKLFQDGETTGVFQFESSGMKRYLRELKPTELEDIIAMVALYRPGPMEWIPDYINRKHGSKRDDYLHPQLEQILKKTHGVAIYQEQVMQIARDLAGFSMGQADVLRKAMGKKIPALLQEQKEKFISGCTNNGLNSDLAQKLFSFIEPFAGYGFNRSHAACYAMIGYHTAYLKAHYPAEFMAALLTADQDDIDRITIEIEECRRMGIKIMPPDVNESFATFTVVTEGTARNTGGKVLNMVRFGLKAIKNVGGHIAEVIISERKASGPYQDIYDMLERITDRDLNKKSLESLIKGGAMDNYGERGLLLANVDAFLEFSRESNKIKASRQESLFSNTPQLYLSSRPQLKPAKPVPKAERLAWEKELLGLYLSEHPFSNFKLAVSDYVIPLINLKGHNDELVRTAGIVSTIKKILTKAGQNMLFARIEDLSASAELLVFPKLLAETANIWVDGKPVLVCGRVSNKDGEAKVLVEKVMVLDGEHPERTVDDFKKSMMDQPIKKRFDHGTYVKKEKPAKVITDGKLVLLWKQKPQAPDLVNFKNFLIGYGGNDLISFSVDGKEIKSNLKIQNTDVFRSALKNQWGDYLEIV